MSLSSRDNLQIASAMTTHASFSYGIHRIHGIIVSIDETMVIAACLPPPIHQCSLNRTEQNQNHLPCFHSIVTDFAM